MLTGLAVVLAAGLMKVAFDMTEYWRTRARQQQPDSSIDAARPQKSATGDETWIYHPPES
jgi:hypothetical protein